MDGQHRIPIPRHGDGGDDMAYTLEGGFDVGDRPPGREGMDFHLPEPLAERGRLPARTAYPPAASQQHTRQRLAGIPQPENERRSPVRTRHGTRLALPAGEARGATCGRLAGYGFCH